MDGRKDSEYKFFPFKIAIIYAVVGGIWILFSDRLLEAFIKDPKKIITVAIFKGWFYVLVTAFMIFWLVHRGIKELEKSQNKLMDREEKLTYQAYYDVLTGLPNKNLFMEKLAGALHLSRKYEKMLSVIFIDVDLFKNINDSLGHTVGDRFLVAISERLNICLDDDAVLSRIGGDEFAILLPLIKSEAETDELAKKLLEAFKRPFTIEAYEIYISVSIGISIYPEDGYDIKMLFKNAETAMYYAKKSGRCIYKCYSSEMSLNAARRLALENNLRKALENSELKLHYQPLVEIKKGKVVGMEALLRWTSEELGPVVPTEFIPIAEETGLIVSVGEWVLYNACKQNQEWIEKGFGPLRVSVNVSIRQFYGNGFVETVKRVLADTGMQAQFLNLEITESSLMLNAEECIKVLYRLKELGLTISIDDFGTGYSSLSYLKRLPINTLKIDRSFIKDVTREKDVAAITSAIINLAHSLGLNVVAEGVETQEQNKFLLEHQCDEVQGYLYNRPLPKDDFEKFLDS